MLRRSTPLRPALSCNNSSTNMPVNPLQLNAHGELKHLLTLEGLPRESITHILDTARQLIDARGGGIKKSPLLRGKSVFNLFFEYSTRTRSTFEMAAKYLSADVLNLDIPASEKRRAFPDCATLRAASAYHQCGRRLACTSDARAARYVYDPLLQARFHAAHRCAGRRSSAFTRGAFRHSRADHAGRSRSARGMPAHPAPRRTRTVRRARLRFHR